MNRKFIQQLRDVTENCEAVACQVIYWWVTFCQQRDLHLKSNDGTTKALCMIIVKRIRKQMVDVKMAGFAAVADLIIVVDEWLIDVRRNERVKMEGAV